MLAQLAVLPAAPLGLGFLLFTVFWLVSSAFWLWMLVDCLTRKRLPDNDRLVWVLVLLFTHVIGAILYFLLVRCRRPDGNVPPGGS